MRCVDKNIKNLLKSKESQARTWLGFKKKTIDLKWLDSYRLWMVFGLESAILNWPKMSDPRQDCNFYALFCGCTLYVVKNPTTTTTTTTLKAPKHCKGHIVKIMENPTPLVRTSSEDSTSISYIESLSNKDFGEELLSLFKELKETMEQRAHKT